LRGISSRIRVHSIVGRFLEHSRIFYFENAGKPEVYLGSADWMQRNLYARVEVLFPVKGPQLRERICNEILAAYLADNRKARMLEPTGSYSRPRSIRNGHGFSAQDYLIGLAQTEMVPLNGASRRRMASRLIPIVPASTELPAKTANPASPAVSEAESTEVRSS
jgi:polyphosphate kinase